MELRELRAFVAVVEEGGMSPAARRLHVSQPGLSKAMNGLEREFGVKLLVRSSRGVQATEAGQTFLGEARAVLARYDQAVRVMAEFMNVGSGVLRVGIPLELPSDLLVSALARFAEQCPDTRVQARHLSTAGQLAALRAGELDLGLLRERPTGQELDTMLVVKEHLGVILPADCAVELSGPDGIPLEALDRLEWVGFPRSGSPAWYDELTSILRSHGLAIGAQPPDGHDLTLEVKLAAVGTRRAFALAPNEWARTLPPAIAWSPLAGHPITRRTWAVWPAGSRRRDLGMFIVALDRPVLD
ncbi:MULTISPECIES: LysR substrate-binding domain-containing protein [unclassified Streptomyces]|uniref:LysR substrate-binding domain-containing protein n=1 Tax=unclassified Streptomyces TaxID=2593676 RepID=UPI002E2D1FE6|nr:LysR substrate-binding domain-containing protein [Streptomyces sp. NBC_00223]